MKNMQTPKESEIIQTGQNKQTKPKKKKQGKIQQVWELSQKGSIVKDIAKKTGLSERVVRSYLWRKKNPEKYKELLARYLAKKRTKAQEKQAQPAAPENKT
jgi:hypothetical protein